MTIRSIVAAGMIAAIGAGCAGLVPGKPTSFFTFHDPNAHFEALAETRVYELGGYSFGHSGRDLPVEKHFEGSIKGDQSARNALMQEYRAYIESLLLVSGATIGGESTEGEVSNFEFDYQNSGVIPFFRASSVVDDDGTIHLEIFMSEQKEFP